MLAPGSLGKALARNVGDVINLARDLHRIDCLPSLIKSAQFAHGGETSKPLQGWIGDESGKKLDVKKLSQVCGRIDCRPAGHGLRQSNEHALEP